MRYLILFSLLLLSTTTFVHAKVDLVTLPTRDQVQLNIYNSADLTLVREQRTLTLKQGINRLEFGWADTLIDPTSVHLEAPQHVGQVRLVEVAYPPNTMGSAVWTIQSDIAGEVPVNIMFFTSGLRWQAFYMGTLSTDGQIMHLQNFIRVDNHSGEDYENAKTRVIVGKVQLLDEIAQLAQRQYPYGAPYNDFTLFSLSEEITVDKIRLLKKDEMDEDAIGGERNERSMNAPAEPKKVIKEGLSEYFLYTIEGTETIPNGWGKRLLSLDIKDIPIKTLYRYDEARYNTDTQGFLSFKNDKEHKLGITPLPDGQVILYQELADKQLSYMNKLYTQYIPVEQEVEFALGKASAVKIEPLLMDYRTENYIFDSHGEVSGFDKVEEWQLKLENNRDIPIEVEIFRHFAHAYWKIYNAPDMPGSYEKLDVDTVKYRFSLPAHHKQLFTYTVTLLEGDKQH